MSLVIYLLEGCGKGAASFSKMRKDKLYACYMIMLFGWMIITYVLFTHQPPIFETKINGVRHTKIDTKTLSKLNENIDQFSNRLKHQMQEGSELLKNLKEIAAAGQKAKGVQKEIERPAKTTLKNDVDVVIPILMFACNRISVSKAIDPLLQHRGEDPARRKKFPIIVSQVSLILAGTCPN